MARTLRWQGTFKSLNDTLCTVNIYDEGWTGNVTTLTMADNPFSYEEDDSDDLLNDVIRSKTGYLRIVENNYGDLNAIFPQTDTEHYVTVYYGSNIVFVGFIQAQSFDREYAPGPRAISVPVVSPLGVTKGLRFTPPSAPYYQTLSSVLKDVCDIMNADIQQLTFPDYMLNNTERVLSLRMNTLSYCPFNEDYNITVGSTQTLYKPQTLAAFIEALCNCFGLMVHDNGTEIIFSRFDYLGVYNQYTVNTMGSGSPSYRPITDGATVINISTSPKSADSNETIVLPATKIDINYTDDINPTYELPYNRTKAYSYGDNWVKLTPSTDEISSPYFTVSGLPTTISNNVACCATNGSDVESSFKEMIMYSRVAALSEIFTWKLYNIPKYANRGCKLKFNLKYVVWHQEGGRDYYETDVDAKAKSIGVRIKNGSFYFQNNGTWGTSPDVLYRNTGGTEGINGTWELTIWTSMNSVVSPLEITFFSGNNNEQTGLYAIEDVKIEPIQKGIAAYINNDISNQVSLLSNNGSDKETSVDQTINVKRKSEDALVNENGSFYGVLACNYNYMFVSQYRINYDTFVLPSTVRYLNKTTINGGQETRIIGFKFDLWNDLVTIMAQGANVQT